MWWLLIVPALWIAEEAAWRLGRWRRNWLRRRACEDSIILTGRSLEWED